MNKRTAGPRPEPLTISIEDGAALLGIGRTTMFKLMKEGAIPTIKIRNSRRVRTADVVAYLDSCVEEGWDVPSAGSPAPRATPTPDY